MVLKGVEIPLFLQDKYEEYTSSIDDMINVITVGPNE